MLTSKISRIKKGFWSRSMYLVAFVSAFVKYSASIVSN